MIDAIANLTKKTNELELNIENLKRESSAEDKTPNCICINKNFNNQEVILTKRILLSKIKLTGKSNLCFQGQVEILLAFAQEVEICLLVNNIIAQKITKDCGVGTSQISIFCNFQPILVENVSISLKITPKSQKPIYLQSASIFVWGTIVDLNEVKYQAIELENNYLISLLHNQSIYYKLIEKIKMNIVLKI